MHANIYIYIYVSTKIWIYTFTNIYICTQIWCIYNGFHTSCARNVVVGIIVENTLAAAQARFHAGLMLPWLINKHSRILSTMLQTFSACHAYWFCSVSSFLRGGWQEERRKTCKAPEGPELFLPFLFFSCNLSIKFVGPFGCCWFVLSNQGMSYQNCACLYPCPSVLVLVGLTGLCVWGCWNNCSWLASGLLFQFL